MIFSPYDFQVVKKHYCFGCLLIKYHVLPKKQAIGDKNLLFL